MNEFRDAIARAGLTPPDAIEADGKLRRFASNGKRGDDAGLYVLHADGIPAGSFGDWRTGFSQSWRADIGRTLTPAEEAAHRAKVDTMRCEREAEEAKRKVEAAKKGGDNLESSETGDGRSCLRCAQGHQGARRTPAQ
jgi:putative DNA primase/helicase